MIPRPHLAATAALLLLHQSLACIPMVPGEETSTMWPGEESTTTEDPTTTDDDGMTTTEDACTTCAPPPPFTCNLDGYDCAGATDDFVVMNNDCAVLTCPDNNLLADNVPVTTLTCNSDAAWYYTDANGVITLAATALCVSPCTECAAVKIPPTAEYPPPKGSIYLPATVNSMTKPCPSASCKEGTLVGVRECEKKLSKPLTCNGKAQWTSGGLVYQYAACKITCDNCPAPAGYADYPPSVSAHQKIVFDNYQFQCAQVTANCPAGYALRITKADGSDEIIAAENVASVDWTCRNTVWTITYTNNNGVASMADVTNSECYTGTCIACSPPMLVKGVTANIGFNMETGCKYYLLSGCGGNLQYRANGKSFGVGVNRIRCANVPANDAMAGWYGAGDPVRWFQSIDAIGCA